MYLPDHFAETRTEVLHALIRAHPLGLLITHGPDGLQANAIPFLLDPDLGPHGRLRAHVARANPQWRSLLDVTEALVVFQGPHAYVSPGWYATKAESGKVVPTWNYALVQARGRPRVADDRAWLGEQVRALTAEHEAAQPAPWQVDDAPERYIETQMRGIVGVEIEIAALVGKWKVSQNRSAADREGVVAGLGQDPMAALVGARSEG